MGQTLPRKQGKAGRGTEPGRMTFGEWLRTFKASWKMALHLDRSSLTPFQAVRSTLGVGVPLLLGIATGQVETGVLIASGALMLGSVGLKDPYQKRAQTMLLACVFVTLSALVGGVVGGLGWLPVLISVGVWGLVAGMFASINQTAQVVAIQACSALIVYTHLDLDPPHALLVAGAVGLGTLLQLFLATIPSPWTNTIPERTALATIYRKLAEAASKPSDEQTLQASEALLSGHNTLLSGNTRSEKGRMFARLLEEAEHLRLTLFVLRRQQQYFEQRATDPALKSASAYLDQIIRTGASALQSIALELQSSSNIMESGAQARRDEMKRLIGELRKLAEQADNAQDFEQTLAYCTALLGELHIARRLSRAWRYARQYWPVRIRFPYPRPPHLYLEDIRTNLRANLTPRSNAFRHAVRLSVVLLLATLLYQVFHLSVERGYWIPMTAALVLRSDFSTTFTRGIARLLGTMLGAVLTTLLVVLLLPSQGLLVAFIILASYVMFTTLFANYAIFSVGTTMAVVFLLSFINAPTVTTALDRALDTIAGGLLALLVYAAWPTWEQSQVPENIAQRLEMLGLYVYTLMQAYADPGQATEQTLEKYHKESRLARSNARGSVQRSLQEPPAHRVDAELAEGLLVAADTISRSALVLEAYLNDNPQPRAFPAALDFAQAVKDALETLATAVRTRQPVNGTPALAAAFQRLKASTRASRQLQPGNYQEWQFVTEEAKRVMTSIQAMQQMLATSSFS
jgi:uncharacterized membrane protein YccC